MSNSKKFWLLVLVCLIWAFSCIGIDYLYNIRQLRLVAVLPLILTFGLSLFTNYPRFINDYFEEQHDKHGPVPIWLGLVMILGAMFLLDLLVQQ